MSSEWEVIHGDCLEVLRETEDAAVDAIVTDPPYELGFMGKRWDSSGIAYSVELWRECLRVLKPGGHLLAFGGTRTYHRMTCAIEDAGFEVRDSIHWLYATGFPKSLDVSKAIDSRPGVTMHADFARDIRYAREALGLSRQDVSERVVGTRSGACWNWEHHQFPESKWWPKLREVLGLGDKWEPVIAEAERDVVATEKGSRLAVAPGQNNDRSDVTLDITVPATDAARQWSGWGTALKPAHEPVVLARKPLIGTVAANVQEHGTGAINIDGCRIGTEVRINAPAGNNKGTSINTVEFGMRGETAPRECVGRWPANVVLSHAEDCEASLLEQYPGLKLTPEEQRKINSLDKHGVLSPGCAPGCAVAELDAQVAPSKSRKGKPRASAAPGDGYGMTHTGAEYDDAGGPSRFYYVAKPSRRERDAGAENKHPTVKPITLMRYLIRLITPPGGLVLDPFAGSGTTGCAAALEGVKFVGIEREEEYANLARRRIAYWSAHREEEYALDRRRVK